MAPPPIRVLLADDHTLFREGLRRLLETDPRLRVVGESSTADDAVRKAVALKPDVVLLDVSMPGLPAWEAVAAIRRRVPGATVVALTMHGDSETVLRMIRAGSRGYWIKSATAPELIDAVRLAAAGGASFHPQALHAALAAAGAEATPPTAGDAAGPAEETGLSPREREVLALVGRGWSNREIAARLYLSEKTVRNHLANARGKLGLANRTQLALWAVLKGLSPLAPPAGSGPSGRGGGKGGL